MRGQLLEAFLSQILLDSFWVAFSLSWCLAGLLRRFGRGSGFAAFGLARGSPRVGRYV